MHDENEMPDTDTRDTSSSEDSSTESSAPSAHSATPVTHAAPVTLAAPDAPGVNDLSPAMLIRDRCIAVLKTVYDPEIPVDI